MKLQRDLAAWICRNGNFQLPLPSPQVKGFIITDGASVSIETDGYAALICSGRGRFDLDFVLNQPGQLVVQADNPKDRTSVHLVGWGPADQPIGFLGTESYVQLDAKSRNAIPPEVQRMFDLMNQNAARRENALIEQLQRAQRVTLPKIS